MSDGCKNSGAIKRDFILIKYNQKSTCCQKNFDENFKITYFERPGITWSSVEQAVSSPRSPEVPKRKTYKKVPDWAASMRQYCRFALKLEAEQRIARRKEKRNELLRMRSEDLRRPEWKEMLDI